MNNSTLYLIRGIPGSGKSSLGRTLKASGVVQHVFEADQYFIDGDGNYEFNKSDLHNAHKSCYIRTKYFLLLDQSVAVCNTSTTEKEVQQYQELANELGCKFISLIVESRHEGNSIHDVPLSTIQNMKDRFSFKL